MVEDAFLRTCIMERIKDFRVHPGNCIDRSNIAGELRTRETMGRLDSTEIRRFSLMEYGLMGLFPLETRPHDMAFVFAGADVPVVIRNVPGLGNVIVGSATRMGS
jgi:hypothetical protein